MPGLVETLPEGLPKLTVGWHAAAFAAKYLRHPNGPRAGERWQFTPSQLRFVLWWYAVDDHGRWIFRHGVRRLAKGSGKSPIAAALALTEFCGPVRFAGFDQEMPGGVLGKQVAMPLVQIAATAESQTANTMRSIVAMCAPGSRLVRDFRIDAGKTVMYRPGGGMLQVITSSMRAQEGAEPTFIVADETEHWIPGGGGPELSGVLDRNLKKSGSRMLETSNAWRPGEDSVAEATWEAFEAQVEGRAKGRTHILYDARYPRGVNLADTADLRAGLKAAYGDCYWVDLDDIHEAVIDPRTKPDDALRFYFNLPTAAEDAWVTLPQWQALAAPAEPLMDGQDIAMFFDGSKSGDATALIGCRLADGFVFNLGVWEPPAGKKAGVVPVQAVDAAVARAFEKYRVWAFFADVKEWESFTKLTWPQEYGKRLAVWAAPNGKDPQPIAWDMRSRLHDFTMAAELTETEIAEGAFHHDGDSRVQRHVVNARRRPNRWGVSIGKESPKSPRKIDAAVCVIGARMVRRQVIATPRWRRHTSTRKKRAIVLD